jgi:hypothetical protein
MAPRPVRQIPSDGWAGAVLLAASLFFLVHLIGSQSEGVTAYVSATTLPTVLAGVMAVLGALLLVGASRQWRRAAPVQPVANVDRGAAARVLLLVGGTAAYIALLPWLGYLFCTALYIGSVAWLFGNRRPWVVLLMMLLVPAALLLFFEKFMIIPLPSAALFG